MQSSDSRRGGTSGLPRSTFSDDFFRTDPFRDFDPSNQGPTATGGGFARRFGDGRGRLFDDDSFFDGFARRPFQDEPAFFRSSLPRRPFSSNGAAAGDNDGVERPIRVQMQREQSLPHQRSPTLERKDTAPPDFFQHQRSKSHYDDSDGWPRGKVGGSPFFNERSARDSGVPAGDPNVHVINIQTSPKAGGGGGRQFVEINNAQPNYEHGTLNPDKRRRFSTHHLNQNDHDYANSRSPSIPNITIDDYSDGRMFPVNEEGTKGATSTENANPMTPPMAIPLPPPAIPLPAPERMMRKDGDQKEDLKEQEEIKRKQIRPNQESEKDREQVDEHMDENISRSSPSEADKMYRDERAFDEDEKIEGKPNSGNCLEMELEGNNKKENNQQNFENFVPLTNNGEHLVRLLDETERQVELMRETVARLEQQKEAIFETIKNIKLSGQLLKLEKGDRDELELNAARILTRCKTVEVSVNTPRDEHQSRALDQVNMVIQAVVDLMHEDLYTAKTRIQGFFNACNPDDTGHIDEKFQSLIIACTADDQKKIRRRLAQLIDQIDRAQQMAPQ